MVEDMQERCTEGVGDERGYYDGDASRAPRGFFLSARNTVSMSSMYLK